MGSPRQPKRSTSLIGALDVVDASLAMGARGRPILVGALLRLRDELARRVDETDERDDRDAKRRVAPAADDGYRSFVDDQRARIVDVKRLAQLVQASSDSPAQQVMLRRALGAIRRVCLLETQRRGAPGLERDERIWQ